ncbi:MULTISPECIES: flagellar basal-body MS-ring/collar protein FliF [unclassified Carboxydocella]|uniref:flagellar basal-body MS-ring/collar protein FliF n=1 Tax=unclassified Carboxydocella TaxID=2685367 RepID=UPI0009AC5ADA|nr:MULTISPECIES: flagellar basal-body MS-ring/collar protein FliF [unclassified Carboxydocella]GAW28304.1 Flagellar M-ring protein [Carboxydocella sp. ULO1]GAW32125.1 Flagellar M-ring protein [Carboxydocella sp. JDF658]
MKELYAKVREKLMQFWQQANQTQKILALAAAVTVVVAIGAILYFYRQPDYQPLFTNLEAADAGAITAKLDEMKVPYQVSADGKTILVPADQQASIRLKLASDGVPTGGVVGFELFDQPKFGETDTDRQAKYQRALEGELTRTIMRMNEVEQARVHIVLPQNSLFALENEQEARAAVMLKLKPYQKLKEEQVVGLIRLVANSVKGLKPENVTIVDSNMQSLSDDINLGSEEKNSSKLTASQLELKQQLEKDMEKSAQSMLDRVFGQGKAVVRVTAELDFDRVEINKEDWGDKVTRSEQIQEENQKGSSTIPQGVPGTTTNIPGYQQITQQNNSSESNKSNKIRNYEIDRTQEHRVVAPGSIKRLSVAVMVDGQRVKEDQVGAVQEVVASALGVDTARGDMIKVTAIPFDTSDQQALAAELTKAEKMELYKQIAIWAGIAIVLIWLAFMLKKVLTPKGGIQPEPVSVEQLLAGVSIEKTQEKSELEKIQEEIEQLAKKEPENVAGLLRTWLAEE